MRRSILGLGGAAVVAASAAAGWTAEPAARRFVERVATDRALPGLLRTQAALERSRTPRSVKAAAPALLAGLDGLVATSPRNPELLELAARGDASFALTCVEDDDPAWAKELYEKAHGYALRALAERDEALLAKVLSPIETAPALGPIDERDVPALFWLALSWGCRINLDRSDEKLLVQLGKVDRAMRAVLEKDEGFFYGAPHLYFGVRYGCLSPSFGGDPARARRHFAAAERLTHGRNLFAKLLRAQFLSCTLPPEAVWSDFHGTLCEIVDAPDDLWPEQRLANEVAKERARRLGARPSDANVLEPAGVVNRFADRRQED